MLHLSRITKIITFHSHSSAWLYRSRRHHEDAVRRDRRSRQRAAASFPHSAREGIPRSHRRPRMTHRRRCPHRRRRRQWHHSVRKGRIASFTVVGWSLSSSSHALATFAHALLARTRGSSRWVSRQSFWAREKIIISEKLRENKKTSGNKRTTDWRGERFQPWPFPPSPPPSPLIKQYHSLDKGISIFLDATA